MLTGASDWRIYRRIRLGTEKENIKDYKIQQPRTTTTKIRYKSRTAKNVRDHSKTFEGLQNNAAFDAEAVCLCQKRECLYFHWFGTVEHAAEFEFAGYV